MSEYLFVGFPSTSMYPFSYSLFKISVSLEWSSSLALYSSSLLFKLSISSSYISIYLDNSFSLSSLLAYTALFFSLSLTILYELMESSTPHYLKLDKLITGQKFSVCEDLGNYRNNWKLIFFHQVVFIVWFGELFIYKLLEFFMNHGTNYSGICYTFHIDVSNPFPGWVFVSIINWHILINRKVFICKRKNEWDAQSFNVRNLDYFGIISCNMLQNGRIYLQVYLRWWCLEWNHSWSAQQEEDICLPRWSVPCKPLTWLFI